MTKSRWMMVLGAVAVGMIFTFSVVAQQGAATSAAQTRRAPAPVALVDVAYIVSQNASVETKMAAITEKYSKLLQETMNDAKEITQMRELLTTYDRNSDIYRETEQKMLSRASELDSKRLMLFKQAAEERIHLFNSVYTTVVDQTKRCASHFGMTVVLNYDRNKLLEEVPLLTNPQQYDSYFAQYMQAVGTRTVVWADDKAVDLTSLVLSEIQKADPSTRKSATTVQTNPAAAGQTAAGQTVRPNAAVGTQVQPTAPATGR